MDICFRTALSCERGTMLRKGIVQLQTKVRAKRTSLAIRLVRPALVWCPGQLLHMVWCFLFDTVTSPESCARKKTSALIGVAGKIDPSRGAGPTCWKIAGDTGF